MAAPAEKSQRICVARLGAAHGVRGEVKLWSFTAEPAAVVDYGPFETDDGRVIEIEALRPAKDFFVARLKGVTDLVARRSYFRRVPEIPQYGVEPLGHVLGHAIQQEGRRPKPLRPAKAGTQQIAVEQNGGRGRLVNHAGW